MEFRFQPGPLPGDPDDPDACDVRCLLVGPGGLRRLLPAFHDLDGVWAVRHTPERAGLWRVAEVRVGGRKPAVRLPEPQRADAPEPLRFVRRHPRIPTRLADDTGAAIWPIGHNLGWSGDTPRALVRQLEAMRDAGLDWTRIWMCHWDGKNLDWPADPKTGGIRRDAALRWDTIVAAAQRCGIRLQMVLQHHGQISTRTNPNWAENPWNAANGGFLKTPEEFFTHPEARRRTRAKLRYAVARWGYSPAIFAWELFNEVEWVDAVVAKRYDSVAAWHREMAAFLRAHDPWRHLVATSSDRAIPHLYDAMDFEQPHAYPPDGIAAVRALVPAGKPSFFGEIGPGAFPLDQEDGRFLRPTLWAGIATQESGAPQYWTWDTVERARLYPIFASAARFVRGTGLAAVTGLRPAAIAVRADAGGRVGFGPGKGWGETSRTRYPVGDDGAVEGVGEMPAYLQGSAHRQMFPHADFPLDAPRPLTVRVRVRQSAKAGAALRISVDGTVAAERAFPAAEKDVAQDAVVEASVPAGRHTVRIENPGADWLVLERIEIDPYGPALRALGRVGGGRAVAYVWKTVDGSPAAGRVEVPGLAPGRYVALWWDVAAGRPISRVRARATAGRPLSLETPPVVRDVALWIEPA